MPEDTTFPPVKSYDQCFNRYFSMGQPDEEKKKGLGASFAAHLHPLLALMLASVLLCMHQFHKNKAVSPSRRKREQEGRLMFCMSRRNARGHTLVSSEEVRCQGRGSVQQL